MGATDAPRLASGSTTEERDPRWKAPKSLTHKPNRRAPVRRWQSRHFHGPSRRNPSPPLGRQAAPPHYVAFREWVEHSYDPETGQFASCVVLSMPPVVTLWREDTAAQGPRDVGAWAVTPQPDGLTYEARHSLRELGVTAGQRSSLKLLADLQGGAVTQIWPRRFLHDLDASFTVEEWERTRGRELATQRLVEQQRQRQEALAQRQSKSRTFRRRQRKKEENLRA